MHMCASVQGLSLRVQNESVLAGATSAALMELDGFSWDVLMLPAIQASDAAHAHASLPDPSSSYLLLPLLVSASLTIDLSGAQNSAPLLNVAAAAESPLAAALTHSQLDSLQKLGEAVGRMARRHELSDCGRPAASPVVAPAAWWGYAVRAAIAHRRAHTVQLNWAELQARRRARAEYVRIYAEWCEAPRNAKLASALLSAERTMLIEDILRYRRLVRAREVPRQGKGSPKPSPLMEEELQVIVLLTTYYLLLTRYLLLTHYLLLTTHTCKRSCR